MVARLEFDDIQGIIVRGYGYLPSARFVVLGMQAPAASRQWLADLASEITNASTRPPNTCVNIAFTYGGLSTLGMDVDALSQFAREFQEGMTTPHRGRILGDHGASAPEHWCWGSDRTAPVHALLMLYATDAVALEALYEEHATRFGGGGLSRLAVLDTLLLQGRKEHFGFRDGIGQPTIAGGDPAEPLTANTVAAGEFLLGYLNEYGEYMKVPSIPTSRDPGGLLPHVAAGSTEPAFGRNGSYLVVRQLSQDVGAFWRFVDHQAKDQRGRADPQRRLRLAAKMVGRWPSGAPLVTCPHADDPARQDEDGFGFHALDPQGLLCPVGAHIRRTNPRDAFADDPDESIKLVNRHRIIRRGRAYGAPLADSLDPQEMLDSQRIDGERGLHFMCFNANIARQFEFLQQTWINNPKFGGLYDDRDPIMGDQNPNDDRRGGTFTIPAEPVRERVTGIPRFVEVKGGAYFFMPGIRALRYLSGAHS